MKKTLRMMVVVGLALAMFACGNKEPKLTIDDLRAAQATLFNDDRSVNEAVAPEVAEKYCQFVKQNPDDSTAAQWLYHAMEINVLLKDADKSAAICDQLTTSYPESSWTPMSLFLMGLYYNDQLNDTAKAHVMFQRLIDEYPKSELVDDAQKSIEYLGLTPEEIMARIMVQQMEEQGAIEE